MVRWLTHKRYSSIGVDIGSRSVKLVQLSDEGRVLLEAARWDLPGEQQLEPGSPEFSGRLGEALRRAREGRKFRGRNAVLSLGNRELFLQNIRIPKAESGQIGRLVQQEAAGRVPYSVAEAEIRYFEAADVRQGDLILREVILLACHRPVLQSILHAVQQAGLRPVYVDVEPSALLRSYLRQFRRDQDRQQRAIFVHVGFSKTAVVIAQGDDILFIKYVDVGGRQMDQAVSSHLNMELADATALRRHNGDRRSEQQDPEISQSVAEAIRPVVEQLAGKLSMCIRYHSVTFRGQPLARLILGGGEATPTLLETLAKKVDVRCELGDPLRCYNSSLSLGRRGQWDIATGLALRSLESKT